MGPVTAATSHDAVGFARLVYGLYRTARPESWCVPDALIDQNAGTDVTPVTALTFLRSARDDAHRLILTETARRGGCLCAGELLGMGLAVNSVDVDARRFATVCDMWCRLAEHFIEPLARSVAHRLLAQAHSRCGDHAAAQRAADTSLCAAAEADNFSLVADGYYIRSWCHELAGDYEDALLDADSALLIAHRESYVMREVDALNAIGVYALRLDRMDDASGACRRALDLARRCGARKAEIAALDSLSDIEWAQGDLAAARSTLRCVRDALIVLDEPYHLDDVNQRLDRLDRQLEGEPAGHPIREAQIDQQQVH